MSDPIELLDAVVQIPDTLTEWLCECPDNAALHLLLRKFAFSQGDDACRSCGDTFPRHEMRFITYADEGRRLVCDACWHTSIGNPSFSPAAWPLRINFPSRDEIETAGLVDARLHLISTGEFVGEVKGCDPETGMCREVRMSNAQEPEVNTYVDLQEQFMLVDIEATEDLF